MQQQVVLSIQGKQSYLDQEPEIIELVTDGILEPVEDGWNLWYEESDLTGMEGVTTTFRIRGNQVTLTRTGNLHSEMVFQPGFVHESLYRLEFGALMLRVCATKVEYQLDAHGGTVDLSYSIEIEHNAAGVIDYHLKIRSK